MNNASHSPLPVPPIPTGPRTSASFDAQFDQYDSLTSLGNYLVPLSSESSLTTAYGSTPAYGPRPGSLQAPPPLPDMSSYPPLKVHHSGDQFILPENSSPGRATSFMPASDQSPPQRRAARSTNLHKVLRGDPWSNSQQNDKVSVGLYQQGEGSGERVPGLQYIERQDLQSDSRAHLPLYRSDEITSQSSRPHLLLPNDAFGVRTTLPPLRDLSSSLTETMHVPSPPNLSGWDINTHNSTAETSPGPQSRTNDDDLMKLWPRERRLMTREDILRYRARRRAPRKREKVDDP